LKQEIESGLGQPGLDGLTPSETFQAVARRVRRMVAEQYANWREKLQPALAAKKIRILGITDLGKADRNWLEVFYWQQVHPVLTPLAIDPAHPFPQLLNKSLNLIVRLEMRKGRETHKHMAVVQLPAILPRLVQLPRKDRKRDYVYLGDLIGHYLADVFPGTTILGWWPFRVTRNSELYIDTEEENNLLKAVELELHNRRKGDAVRLELDHGCPSVIRDALLKTCATRLLSES
jgi:polyphosphate kinase